MSTKTENSTIDFKKGTILHEIRVDKYTRDVREVFIIEAESTDDKIKIPKDKLLEIAKFIKEDKSLNYLINHGYPANDKMKAGSGLAVKINPQDDFYELTFYIGNAGVAFDASKLERKSYITIEKNVLNTIFEYLKYNDEVLSQKAEIQRTQRTILTLS